MIQPVTQQELNNYLEEIEPFWQEYQKKLSQSGNRNLRYKYKIYEEFRKKILPIREKLFQRIRERNEGGC